MENIQRICRFCLRKCGDFKAVEDYTNDVLDILLLKINLSVSEKPVMCTTCATALMKCFDFKATCFYTQDYIIPFLADKKISKLDLKIVYKSTHENVIDIPKDHTICGLCIGLPKRSTAISLNNGVKKLIERCLPELDLNTIEEPVICAPCHDMLQNCFQFVTNCLMVEKKIMECRKFTDTDTIEFTDILQLTSRNISKVGDGSIDITGTEGNLCIDADEEQVVIESGSFLNVEQQQLLLNNDLEVKTDQHDLNKSLDAVVSSPVSTRLRKRPKCVKSQEIITHKHKLTCGNVSTTYHQCDFCSYKTRYKSGIKKHMIAHKPSSETTMYRCDSCGFNTKYKQNLRGHMLIHKDTSEVTMYRCDLCSYQTKHKNNVELHMLSHKLPMYQCHSCSYKAKHKSHIRAHMLIHKNPSEITMHQCDLCSFQSKHKIALKRHMDIHKLPSEIKVHRCDICDYKSNYKGNLAQHKLSHKDPSEVTMHRCGSCSFQTKYKYVIRRHMEYKHSLKKTMYRCRTCDFKTKYKCNLDNHMLTHKDSSEVTFYQCDSCSFKTKHKKYLHIHLVTHKPLRNNNVSL